MVTIVNLVVYISVTDEMYRYTALFHVTIIFALLPHT